MNARAIRGARIFRFYACCDLLWQEG